MKVAAIVPWRDKGNPRRRANLRRTLAHMEAGPWPVYVVSDGRADSDPFGRQHAYNRGMTERPADVWVFCEADMIVSHAQVLAAIHFAINAPGLVVPFDARHELGPEDSIDVASGADPSDYSAEHVHRHSYGAVNVVSAETMRLVGRWDEALTGHWWDDTAMKVAFEVAAGNPTRYVPGPGYHLWHPMGYSPGRKGPEGDPANFDPADVAATEQNRRRYEMYAAAKTPDEIRRLTAGALEPA